MNPFLRQPLALQRTPLRAERPEPRLDAAGVVSLRLYDPIDDWGGPWGVSANEFVSVLDELPADTSEIRLLVNSPGGVVWEGLAILNSLRAHPARVVAVVEGVAASSASFIAAGVDELHVMANAELFVHNAWGLCVGNAADMERMARDLGHEDRNIASIYAAKAGDSVDDWLAAMADERWYSAQEAVDAGLADRVIEPNPGRNDAASARARFDLSALSRNAVTTRAAAAVRTDPHGRSRDMAFSAEQLSTMRARLGLAADADEQTIHDALIEALDEQVEPPSTLTPTALPDGVVAVEASAFADLQARAARGDEARSRQESDDRAALVSAAVADGRISPARREAWLTRLAADPGEADTLAALQAGISVPVGAPIGYATGGDAAPESAEERLRRGGDTYAARHGKSA